MADNETYKLLGFDEFLSLMKKSVKEAFGVGYNVEVNHVLKNNSIELDGLIILKENERITPNIYMNSYYERYLEGDSFIGLVDEIIHIYKNTRENGEREALCIHYDFSEMKSCIIYRLINYDRNRKLLQEVPHVHFMDLAITFHCLVKDNEQGIGTIRITNEHIKSWNINIEDLKEIARTNTPALFPAVIKNMNEIIQDIFKKDILTQQTNNLSNDKYISDIAEGQSSDELFQIMLGSAGQHKNNNMYVITNTKGINGASCLLYPDVIKELAEKLESDLYILPSSIHEIIIVKSNASLDKKSFEEMVFDVNRTQVAEEDILSDSVYFFSRERNAITV